MNEAAELVSELRRRGFKYCVRDGKLVVQPAPDPAFLDQLRAHKPEVLALLQGPTCSEREAGLDRIARSDGWISNASPAQALARDLVTLSREHSINLHAMPEGVLIEVPGDAWREVMSELEETEYHHAI
jgi:hypothetical protein